MRIFRRPRILDLPRPLRKRTSVVVFAALAAAAGLVACGDDDPAGPSAGGDLDGLITAVSVVEGDVAGVFEDESLPAPGSGPAVLMAAEGSWTPGGTATLAVTTTAQTPAFEEILLSSTRHDGFYRLSFTPARSDVVLRLQISGEATAGPLTLRAAGQGGGLTGPYDLETVDVGG